MAFGKNPHVPRAQAAEQEAQDAADDASRARAFRAAAHQWDRAAERELPGKKRDEYERNAGRNRDLADAPAEEQNGATNHVPVVTPSDPKSMN